MKTIDQSEWLNPTPDFETTNEAETTETEPESTKDAPDEKPDVKKAFIILAGMFLIFTFLLAVLSNP